MLTGRGRTESSSIAPALPAGAAGPPAAEDRSVDVFYRSSGQEYHLQTATRIEVLAGRACT